MNECIEEVAVVVLGRHRGVSVYLSDAEERYACSCGLPLPRVPRGLELNKAFREHVAEELATAIRRAGAL